MFVDKSNAVSIIILLKYARAMNNKASHNVKGCPVSYHNP